MYAHCGGALPGVRGVVWCNRLHTHTYTAIAASLRESELRIGGLRSFAPREKNTSYAITPIITNGLSPLRRSPPVYIKR